MFLEAYLIGKNQVGTIFTIISRGGFFKLQIKITL